MNEKVTADPPSKNPWNAEGAEKSRAVHDLFADIAGSYDRLNRLFSVNLDRSWRRKAAEKLNLKSGDSALDLCCGTGDFLPILRAKVGAQGKLFGADFCLPMLTQSARKDPAPLLLADACHLPYRSGSLDAVSVGWGIRNVPDIDLAHQEIHRVLKSGGRFVSVDMAVPKNPVMKVLSTWVFMKVVPKVGGWLSNATAYAYLPQSTQRFMTRDQLKQSMERAGFIQVSFQDLFFGNICIHWGTKS